MASHGGERGTRIPHEGLSGDGPGDLSELIFIIEFLGAPETLLTVNNIDLLVRQALRRLFLRRRCHRDHLDVEAASHPRFGLFDFDPHRHELRLFFRFFCTVNRDRHLRC